ncbi:MAG: bifunctional folylpolyglutamate synthase/dihydrofolate synthase [Bacteroidales bacterium]|nr:bifunctional folylpolyglutamate synthase/dihydrofolate synthase [Bacteroidales bacterium]
MTYEEQIERLYNRFPSFQIVGNRAYKPGIETVKELDEALGRPHERFKTIHVAGTNGKGSVCHLLASALAHTGLKVGLYSSPHLVDFRERMKIVTAEGYRMISREAVSAFLTRWDAFFDEHNPSFFEITTAMAFDFFASEAVDVAVIETGLGGRLDSTNIITPVLSVITNIGLEHCTYLGYTLEEIAFEKGGIIKPGVPVVIGNADSHTAPVFDRLAKERNAPITYAQEYDTSNASISADNLDLKGDYQHENLRTVLCALNQLGLLRPDAVEGLKCAAATTGLRGRWESINLGEGKPRLICDIGHNPHGLKWVFSQLKDEDAARIFIVFGMVADKDLESAAEFMPRSGKHFRYIFTQASTDRALRAKELAERLRPFGIRGRVVPGVKKALESALKVADSNDLIFVGGSNFTVADALLALES